MDIGWYRNWRLTNNGFTDSNYVYMKHSILLIVSIFVFWGCDSNPVWVEPDDYKIELDGRLPKDQNGFYHLTLLRDRWQTVHRVSGTILLNGKVQSQPQKIHWESSHSWEFKPGDTLITIYRRNVDMNGRWVIVDTQTVVASDTMFVPTVNSSSYSDGRSGEINTMIGPVLGMLGDTMTVKCWWTSGWYNTDTVSQFIKVVLD